MSGRRKSVDRRGGLLIANGALQFMSRRVKDKDAARMLREALETARNLEMRGAALHRIKRAMRRMRVPVPRPRRPMSVVVDAPDVHPSRQARRTGGTSSGREKV